MSRSLLLKQLIVNIYTVYYKVNVLILEVISQYTLYSLILNKTFNVFNIHFQSVMIALIYGGHLLALGISHCVNYNLFIYQQKIIKGVRDIFGLIIHLPTLTRQFITVILFLR